MIQLCFWEDCGKRLIPIGGGVWKCLGCGSKFNVADRMVVDADEHHEVTWCDEQGKVHYSSAKEAFNR